MIRKKGYKTDLIKKTTEVRKMSKKKILSILMISLIVLGTILFIVNNLQAADCSASTQCANGKTVWCKAFGDSVSCEADANGVTCTGGGVTNTWSCTPAN